MKNSESTILIIVGITGDLAVRKLLPAIAALHARGVLPEQFHLVGITRQAAIVKDERIAALHEHSTILQMDIGNSDDYEKLATVIKSIEASCGSVSQRLVYLSVPPRAALAVIGHIGSIGITRLLLEKPFGTDLPSAQRLMHDITLHFKPDQVYLVDHYTAKQLATDIAHMHDEHRHKKIARIEIIASESFGIEGRGNFYEQTGALRDIVQNHLLQLLAIVLAGTDAVAKVFALKHLTVVSATRGQYDGYTDEVGNRDSHTETAVVLTLASSDPKWSGVPIILATGKRLAVKETAVRVMYADGTADTVTDMHPHTTYERVFDAAIHANHRLFVSPKEVIESWRIVMPILEVWQKRANDLVVYQKGASIKELM